MMMGEGVRVMMMGVFEGKMSADLFFKHGKCDGIEELWWHQKHLFQHYYSI